MVIKSIWGAATKVAAPYLLSNIKIYNSHTLKKQHITVLSKTQHAFFKLTGVFFYAIITRVYLESVIRYYEYKTAYKR